jgi:sulfatase modifying factor 1
METRRANKSNQVTKLLACLFLLGLIMLPVQAQAAKRYALLIGMELYPEISTNTNNFGPLNKPVNDVAAVRLSLENIGGYNIVEILDQNDANTKRLIKKFIAKLPLDSEVLVFYSGHGVTVDNEAYLMPITSGYSTGQDVKSWGVGLSWLQGSLQEKDPHSLIIVLDTCRTHIPLYAAKGEDESFVASSPSSPNTLIAYATIAGYYAYEGNPVYPTSDYTRLWVKALENRASWRVPAYQLFYEVSEAVGVETGNRQIPGIGVIPGGNRVCLGDCSSVVFVPPVVEPVNNHLAMQFIPGGQFKMGQTVEEKQWLIKEAGQEIYDKHYADEKQKEVTVEGYYLAKHEVTVDEFRRFINQAGYTTEAESGKGCSVYEANGWLEKPELNWRNPGFLQTGDHPVVCVSYNDVSAYIDWLNKNQNKKGANRYRLPTEAEWERAARGGKTGYYWWGDDAEKICQYANGYDRTGKQKWGYNWYTLDCDDGYAATAPVGSYADNHPYQLQDIIGNVWEWTSSCYSNEYDGSEMIAGKENDSCRRVLRGGSWGLDAWSLRSANRGRDTRSFRFNFIGFRLAMTR